MYIVLLLTSLYLAVNASKAQIAKMEKIMQLANILADTQEDGRPVKVAAVVMCLKSFVSVEGAIIVQQTAFAVWSVLAMGGN